MSLKIKFLFKVMSQREQILVVPMTHLEDVRKNITETVNAKTDADGLAFTDIQSFTENSENGYTSSVIKIKIFSSYSDLRHVIHTCIMSFPSFVYYFYMKK